MSEKSVFISYIFPTAIIFSITSNKNINTTLFIIDATGRIVKKLEQKINLGNNSIQIDVNNLPSGQYIIRSSDDYTNINKKFTIFK